MVKPTRKKPLMAGPLMAGAALLYVFACVAALYYMKDYRTEQKKSTLAAANPAPTADHGLTVGFTKEIIRAGNGEKPTRGQQVTVRSS
jgi:FKBP-type peptidyl-prolyl cis-trans isomerase